MPTSTSLFRISSKDTREWGEYSNGKPSISGGKKELSREFPYQEFKEGAANSYRDKLYESYKTKDPDIYNLSVTWKVIKDKISTVTIPNPLEGTPKKDAFAFDAKPKPQYYLRFEFLLEYVKDNILPKVKTDDTDGNPPIFDIDSDPWSNHMFSLPNQISLDPRVCVVRNDNFITSAGKDKPTTIFHDLETFREVDNKVSQNQNAAYPMNIYLNFNFIIECLKTDERGDVNVYDFIKSICDGLNKALGGINNLEPVIDEESNTLKIVDTTPIPGYTSVEGSTPYTLQLYGYDKTSTGYISNFIRNVDLKTAITPEFATMITVGATAGGYVKGVEATAFSKWNVGLVDRFKEEFIPGNPASQTETTGVDEAEYNYTEKILSGKNIQRRYGFTSLTQGSLQLSDDIIEGNISVGTEYFKYIMAKNQSNSGGTIGFIPFKISFTMDGLSGIKIYNKLNVDTRFLPRAYGNNLDLIVTGVSHKLSKNDWETDIEATVIPKTTGDVTIGFSDINAAIQQSTGTSSSPRNSSCPVLPPLSPPRYKSVEEMVSLTKNIFPDLPNTAVAAIVGQLKVESAGRWNTLAYNGSAGGCGAFGMAQWRNTGDTPSNPGTQRRLFAFAESKGLDVADHATQLKFLRHDLITKYKRVWDLLKNKNLTLTQHIAVFHMSYGLGNSNPLNYYKKITSIKEWEKEYLSLGGKSPKYIPSRYKATEQAYNLL